MSTHYLLIGASAASIGALHTLRRLDPDAQFTCITNEQEFPYNKCLLAEYLAGDETPEKLSISSPKQLEGVSFHAGKTVVAIDPAKKMVTGSDGSLFNYDKLFLGMGSRAFVPPIPGVSSAGIFTFHTLADTQKILAYSKQYGIKKVAILGAGLSGLEAADALAKQGLHITLIERNSRVLPTVLTDHTAVYAHTLLHDAGVTLYLNESASHFYTDTQGKVSRIQLASGAVVDAPLVIIATGMRANIDFLADAGIASANHGVVVNEYMQTNIPDIYAGGDLIQVTDLLTGIQLRSCMWPDAMLQGLHAAFAMAGQPKAYRNPALIMSSSFFGHFFAHAGILAKGVPQEEICHQFNVQDGSLKGFQVICQNQHLPALRRLILTGQPVTRAELQALCTA